MGPTGKSIFLVLVLAVIVFSASHSFAIKLPITQTVYLSCILNENSTAEWNGRSATINDIVVSIDGSIIAFTVELATPWEKRLYLMHPILGELTDITASLPGPVNNAFKVRSLQFNHDGSRLFFVWNWLQDIYYYEGGACQLVVEGITSADTSKPFAIDGEGTKVIFRDARWNEAQQKTIRGLFAVEIGGDPQPILDVDDLPCEDDPPISLWYTRLAFLDCAPNGSTIFFRWVIGESAYDKQSLFRLQDGGMPEMYLPEEYTQISSGLKNRIVSDTGEHILCAYRDSGEPWELVRLSSGQKTLLAKTAHLNGFAYASLLSDGSGARFFARQGFRHTVWLPGNEKRDTFSALIPGHDPFSDGFIATDLIKDFTDDFVYFAVTRPGKVDMIHRVKIGDPASDIVIDYDRLPFYTDELEPLTVVAKMDQDLGSVGIEWVGLLSLVEGREYKDWSLENPDWTNVAPISYDWKLYDDGTHGDTTANDGNFTNNTVHLQLDSGFYNANTFPCYPGIRVVKKDTTNYYRITDTYFEVTERSLCEGNDDDDSDVDGSDLVNYIEAFGQSLLTLSTFSSDFGRLNCPP
jgi:hypothetical protein